MSQALSILFRRTWFGLLVGACAPPAPEPPRPAVDPLPKHLIFATAEDAVRHVLAQGPRVIGVGELHAVTDDNAAGPTTLRRFTDDLLPTFAATDLVLETWRVQGPCVALAAAVSEAVRAETHRPEATEDDLAHAVRVAIDRGVRPHDLAITCEEHATLRDDDGGVRHGALLTLLTDRLRALALESLATADARVVLYGGAVHNDLTPAEGTEAYSYAVAARAADPAAYASLDLLDVDVLTRRPQLVEERWAPLLPLARPGHVVLHARGPGDWVLLWPPNTKGP